MARPATIPCPLCGYHAPELGCPHCALAPTEPSLRAARGSFAREWGDGLLAFFHGARALLTTPRTKRMLVPPLILTAVLFGALFAWLWNLLGRFFEAVEQRGVEALGLSPGWWRDVVEWLAGLDAVLWLAHAGSFFVLFVAFSLAALWAFSIAYEAICGPFLDTVQARVETRWFGADPRATLERPPGVDPQTSARWAAIAAACAVALLVAARIARWPWSLAFALAAPIPFFLAGAQIRGFNAWLGWFLGTQLRALWTSLKASLLAAFILVAFLWVKFVPFFGLSLFAMVAGFATALTLLDIPFSRRGWSLRQRLRFVFQHAGAVTALGIVTSLVFVLPLVGPIVGVPCASLGGLWLVCRLDKNRMRPPGRRFPIPGPSHLGPSRASSSNPADARAGEAALPLPRADQRT